MRFFRLIMTFVSSSWVWRWVRALLRNMNTSLLLCFAAIPCLPKSGVMSLWAQENKIRSIQRKKKTSFSHNTVPSLHQYCLKRENLSLALPSFYWVSVYGICCSTSDLGSATCDQDFTFIVMAVHQVLHPLTQWRYSCTASAQGALGTQGYSWKQLLLQHSAKMRLLSLEMV